MKGKKRLVSVALAVILLLVLTGCSPNQWEIFNASMKLQDANSVQEHTTLTFQVSGSGFDPASQKQVDQAAAFLNNAKLDFDVKTNGNAQKTAAKAQVDMGLASPGMNLDVPIWVDSDLTGNTPKIKEIIKIPSLAAVSLPPQFAGKEYMVLNPYDTNLPGMNQLDTTGLMNFSKNMQTTAVEFMQSYAQQFNPGFDAIDNGIQNLTTDAGPVPARMYEIKLNDAQFKAFIRYTVNNFVQDNEAMNFVKQFMDASLKFSQSPDAAQSLSGFDQAFAQFNTNRPQFLAQFNAVMDKLQNVTILGDKGIDIQYAISGGYLVKESGTVNLEVNAAQLSQLMNTLNGQLKAVPDVKGTLDLTVNFSTIVSGINSQPDIQMPALNSDNSFNYTDLINAGASHKSEMKVTQ